MSITIAAHGTPEWHEARRHGIGASEIASVLGISPWESPFSLYWRKVNGWSVTETEAMRTGTILEPAIADWAADQISDSGEIQSDEFRIGRLRRAEWIPWQLCTCDREIWGMDPSGSAMMPVAVLECKWTGSWVGWGEAGTDEIPVYYRTQVLWQCDVLGVERWYLAALGPTGFRLYTGRRDDKDLALMVEAGRRFMDRIEAGDPPPLDDHDATLTALRMLHPELVDEKVEVPESVAVGYRRAVQMGRLADRLKTRYEAKLLDAMGDKRWAVCDGRKVATRVITDVPAEKKPRGPHRKDYLLPPRERKAS